MTINKINYACTLIIVNVLNSPLINFNFFISNYTAVPLTFRDMGRGHLAEAVTHMDAGVEQPWMASLAPFD